MMSVMSHTSLGGGLRCFSRRTAKMAFDRAMSSLGIPDGCRIAPIGLPTTLNATDARAPRVGVPAISVSSPMSIREAPKNGLRTGDN